MTTPPNVSDFAVLICHFRHLVPSRRADDTRPCAPVRRALECCAMNDAPSFASGVLCALVACAALLSPRTAVAESSAPSASIYAYITARTDPVTGALPPDAMTLPDE